MNIQGSYIEDEKLASFAASCSKLYKPIGFISGKNAAGVISRALHDINTAYSLVDRRFGKAASPPTACEWLLDNRYLAQREAKNAIKSVSSIKDLRSCDDGVCIFELARSLVRSGHGKVTEDRCRIFLVGAQESVIIPKNELYLFPSALRAALVMQLAGLCNELCTTNSPEELSDGFAAIFTSLRLIGALDMQKLIESVDATEKLFMSDPAGIYPEMDELSRKSYRDRLSELAGDSISEHSLAKHILKLCGEAEGEARHIGYHLFTEPVGKNAKKRGGGLYIAGNIVLTLFLTLLCGFLSHSPAAALLLLLPISELTKSLLDYIILLSVRPQRMPRLSLENGVPDEGKTICVISALLTGTDNCEKLSRRLEEYYLSNRNCGRNLLFGILADLPEAKTATADFDAELINAAAERIEAMNRRYGDGFFLLTRPRTEDPGRGIFSGYERKRGAVLELAKLVTSRKTALRVSAGNAKLLRGTKYILTLDSDTRLTPDSARELIGAILHPLNKPRLDRERGTVVAGHGIIHPRMSTDITSAGLTDFSRIFSGQGGCEPYSSVCGELYTDLFGRGGFSGKGLIDAEALIVCSDAHIPEGRVLSHDALEGAYLRGGFISDLEFTDSFPSTPIAYYRRLHRWIRGDWQNAPWIFDRNSGFPDIERWKLFDSLRRSLVSPMTFTAITLGLIFPDRGLMLAAWAALLSLCTGFLIALTESATNPTDDIRLRFHSRTMKGMGTSFIRTLLRLWILPYEAWISLCAIFTSLWRMIVSRRNLLEWETSAQSELKKSGIGAYILNMWFALLSGIALLLFSDGITGMVVGLFWLFSPVMLCALSLPAKQAQEISEADREYLKGCAAEIYGYFDTLCTAADNYLPPDNFQEQPPVGIAHRTSPTNIGLALLSELAAADLGIDKDGKCFVLIEKMLTSLEKMPKVMGHFCNWYDTRTLRPLEPAYISTVDSGNLCASLTSLKYGLIEHGKAELSKRVDALLDGMDMSVLFDRDRGLFRIGIDVNKNAPSPAWYDLMASESRLTSYFAVAKGSVPRSHWRRLSRAMLRLDGYQGMASWTGTMFEYLMPELFLPLSRDSLLYESAKYCMYAQKKRRSPSGVWGISESAFFSLDPALNYRYKAHGCGALALKRGQDAELVISPYSSFLAILAEPKDAVKNLRRLEEKGAKGRFGFIEAIDYTPSRCRDENGEQVRCYMAHHLGMSMLAILNCLKDNCVQRRFMRSPEMSAYRCLLEEKLPISSAVLELREENDANVLSKTGASWALRGEDIDFENPNCTVLSNGVYNVMLTESGISSASCRDMLVYKPPFSQVGEGHGIELALMLGDEKISLLPEARDSSRSFMWELGENICGWTLNTERFISKLSLSVSGQDRGELRFLELTAKSELDAKIRLSFEPVLADVNDYVNHPAFWRLGIDAYEINGSLMLHRLPRGRQNEQWMCLACDKRISFSADRSGGIGQLSAPFLTVDADAFLKENESLSMRFALCLGDDEKTAYTGAQHMLAIGPAEFGNMPSASALLMGMNERDIGGAMQLIRPLWFRKACERSLVSRQRLWKYGLSGDLPIICCPPEEVNRESAERLTKQFCLLRSCGVYADLVFVTDEGGDYGRPVYSRVRDTLSGFGLEVLLGVHGGIRILPRSALDEVRAGSVHIIGMPDPERRVDVRYILPEKTQRSIGKTPEFSWDKDGSFKFYVNHSLPLRSWSNMLTNGSFGYLATDCGSGNMWYKNAREMRINRWVNDPYALTGPESLEYINGSGRYSLFAAEDGILCRVRFGFGYASWEKVFGKTGVRCTAFVPCGTDARVFLIELCGDAVGQIAWKTELQLSGSDDDDFAVSCDYVNSVFRAESSRAYYNGLRFLASASVTALGWTCDGFSWLRGEMDGKHGAGTKPVFGAVYPAEKELVIVCGCCEEEALLKLCKPDNARQALNDVTSRWSAELFKFRMSSNNRALDRMMNGWAAYETIACRLLGRSSVYQSGGAIGFRDQLQDAVNMLLISPKYAHEQIVTSCAHQYAEGDVMHWWHPASDGDRGVRTRCSDDLMWLVWALCEYVEKTGDTEICSIQTHYVNSPQLSPDETERYEVPTVTAYTESVLDHAKRAVNCCVKRGTAVHGLLRFGSCDWNDGMNNVHGESVWLTWFFAHTVRRFSDLLVMLCQSDSGGYKTLAEDCGRAADRAWDGAWYLRGYWPDGEKLGSHENEYCEIDSISQSWAAFCSEAQNSRIDTALDSAVEKLFDRENKIIKLFTPPFSRDCRDPGYIKSYGPGFRENGGQYTHSAIWLAMACLRRGREREGYEILNAILPENHDISRYTAEPFVIPADVSSCPGHVGEAGWTWYTGSSGWYFRVVYEELLGLKLWGGKLFIRPSLPDDFPECTVFRTDSEGKCHEIRISGSEILLDGEKYDGKGIP